MTATQFFPKVKASRNLLCRIGVSLLVIAVSSGVCEAQIIIDHTCTDLSKVPSEWIQAAKGQFRIWYGHTSHGSQITTGMQMLAGGPYTFSESGAGNTLAYYDAYETDLGAEGDLSWVAVTQSVLNSPGNDRNMIMWSWCGGVSDNTEAGIRAYLQAMDALEKAYPNVTFVYMTGHLDGTGTTGNLHIRNNQIRDYCRTNKKVLFDFADIESYDPDGKGYLALGANDNCDYSGGNWAVEWCASHPGQCPSCEECAHSQCLNCYQKGKAFWWMMARLAGWDGVAGPAATPTPTAPPWQPPSYPSGFTFVRVPDPLSEVNPTYPLIQAPLPDIGASFFDPHFGTILTRVTRTDGINSRHEYSRFDPFNVDQSLIKLETNEGYWKIYRTHALPYNQQSNLVATLALAELRWDPTRPTLIWGLEEFSIITVDVASGERTVVKNFSEDPIVGAIISGSPVYQITTRHEGEASKDMRFWLFILQADQREDYESLYLFTWDRVSDKILGLYPLPESEREIDWVGMSTLGNWAIIGGAPWNVGNVVGLTVANKELKRFHRLAFDTAHSDPGLDSEGNEVIVMQNSRTDYVDLIPLDWNVKPIMEPGESYEGTGTIPLLRLYYDSESPHGFQSGLHISCNFPGYAVVSTTIEPGLREQNWLDRTIVLLELNKADPKVFYLAKLHNTTQAYWEETHGTITNDGKRIVWADNWGQNVGQEQVFLMQLDMPPGWQRLVTGIAGWESY